MDHEDDVLPINSNLKCHVCGENEFEEREGFYYCQECGTKQEQVRLVEVDRDDDFNQEKLKTKKIKIQVAKAEKPQLTSWECYNYILRGFVEELLSFGAKEELKLMTLQVWAAYLRRMEVAFFNRKQTDLPKLGVKYLQNDVETIYNHSKNARKKRQRRRSEDASCTSGGESSARDWRRNKRKLDESNYSLTSGTSGCSGFTSSTSANSNKAIKLAFNIKARSFYKRTMPKKHLDKHAADAEGLLSCHKQPTSREINRTEYNLMLVNTKQILGVLAIALNLIDDEIQLCDLIRFVNEGHISTTNVLQYFPENVANHGKEMLKKINFYKCPDKYSDKGLRDHIGAMIKHIGIRKPNKPDLVKLVRRYTTELCLPTDISDYIERLINLLPPQFESRTMGYYPGYEARAMAYIIFTLKLLYGLDGFKEHRMSLAAQNLNRKIDELNSKNLEKQPLLFVWNEWVEYIEMRKVIVSQFNSSYCEQFKQCQSTNQLLEEMNNEMRKTEERDNLFNDTSNSMKNKQRVVNFRSLFERFLETYKHSKNDEKSTQIIEFKPSFTPSYTYLKNIFLFCDRESHTNSSIAINIPDFMRIDHSQRDINSYLQVRPLIEYFNKHQLKLNVQRLATTKNKTYVGIFRHPCGRQRVNIKVQKACFDVTEEEWAEIISNTEAQRTDDLAFQTELRKYNKSWNYIRKKEEEKKNELFNPFMNYDLTMIIDDMDDEKDNEKIPNRNISYNNINKSQNVSTLSANANEDLQSMHSFELFSENNMEPIDDQNQIITKPRRNLDNFDLFEGISDEESIFNTDNNGDENNADNVGPVITINSDNSQESPSLVQNSSNPSTPPILEEFIKVEPSSPNRSGNVSKQLKAKPTKEKILKMFVSNMDCWMLLGNMLTLTKGQKSQLQDKFPRSFAWLIETCAQTINVEWPAVYEQLLCIEVMFCLGINDPSNIKNCVYINSQSPIKDIQSIINSYQEIW